MSTKLSNLLPTTNNTNKGIVTKTDDHGSNLKEKLLFAENAINKSIYMKTANFLVKHNAFAVNKSLTFKINYFFCSIMN